MVQQNNYTNDSIESLGDEIEAIRNKPASIGIENHNHLLTEVLANSIDEAREGYGKLIEVIKHKDLSITVKDQGRGIPLGKNSAGEYVYKTNLCKLWTGGKIRNNVNSVGYLYSLGTNGCGLKATNFTSDIFQCTSYRDNKKYFIEYHKGRQFTDLQEEDYVYDNTGTIITWKPSIGVFRTGNDTNSDYIKTMLKQQSIVNKGLKLTFKNEIDDTYNEYYYKYGITDYIKEFGENHNLTDIIYWSTEVEGKDEVKYNKNNDIINKTNSQYKIKCNIGFTFNNYKQLMEFYHNGSYLENGGTPDDFIKNAFVYAIDKYLDNNKLYDKKDKKIKYDDIKDSLIIISDTYSTISLYTDQAKKKIDSDFMKKYMTEYLRKQLEIYFTENPMEAKLICTTILNNRRANDKAEKSKIYVKKKLQSITDGRVKIDGLTDCDMKKSKVDDRWLLVVEGKSPKATVVDAYDNTCMGALGLRGRFISCLKKSVNDVLNNVPAYTLIKALGCGIEIPADERKNFKDIKSFNKENLRYGNIGILTDADCWGSGIRLALLTFIYKYLPTLLKENRVYIIISPRYEIKMKNGKMIYAYNDREKKELMKTIKEEDIYNIGIVKGLGEIDKEDFWDKVLCPKVREKTFIQVNYDNVDEIINKYFEDYMGEDTQPRKDFVREFITNVNLEEINL